MGDQLSVHAGDFCAAIHTLGRNSPQGAAQSAGHFRNEGHTRRLAVELCRLAVDELAQRSVHPFVDSGILVRLQ